MTDGYNIKKHEVDRLVSMTVVLGWELISEVYEDDGPTVTLHRKIPVELLKAAGALERASGPG